MAAVAGCVSADPVEGRWPRAGYDDRNTGNPTDVDAPGTVLTRSWSTEVPDGRFASSPVVADGRLFVGYGEPRPDSGVPHVGVRTVDAASGEAHREWMVTRYDGDRTDGALFAFERFGGAAVRHLKDSPPGRQDGAVHATSTA